MGPIVNLQKKMLLHTLPSQLALSKLIQYSARVIIVKS